MRSSLLVAALAALLTAGCVTVHENRLADGSLSVEIQDNGWYVFGFVPIASGNPDGRWPHWFRNDVDPRKTMMLLDRILERERPDEIGPVVTREEDENILIVVTRVSYHTSAIIPPKKKEQ